jgi:hypothetical protein
MIGPNPPAQAQVEPPKLPTVAPQVEPSGSETGPETIIEPLAHENSSLETSPVQLSPVETKSPDSEKEGQAVVLETVPNVQEVPFTPAEAIAEGVEIKLAGPAVMESPEINFGKLEPAILVEEKA